MTAETKLKWAIITLLAVTILAGIMTAAHAQTCTVGGANTCFEASKKTGESPISTALVWNVVGATSCTAAGGATAWSGPVAASGTKNLTGVTVKMTLTLDCTAPATGGKTTLKWTKPKQNTDGSALTNLGGYIISYGTAAGSLTQTVSIPLSAAQVLTPTATDLADSSFVLDNLTAGTWFASLQAGTAACFPTTLVDCHVSLSSAVTSKAVTTTPGGNLPQLSVVLDPYTVPKAPTNVTASDPLAFEIYPNASGALVAHQVGVIRPGTQCYSDQQQTVAGVTYMQVPREGVDLDRASTAIDKWVTRAYAKCASVSL